MPEVTFPGARPRVAMVVFSYYPDDPRVRREAEALAAAGMDVTVCCLRRPGQPASDATGGVAVRRLPVVRRRGTPLRYLWEYGVFILLAFVELGRIARSGRLAIVHVHTMPDVLVAAALFQRLKGARLILDLHDPMPEVFMTKYGLAGGHPLIRVLRVLERWSIHRADLVLTPNGAFRDLFIGRGCPPARIHVVMNTPDPSIFRRSRETGPAPFGERRPGEFRLMYHGTIVERHGLDTALEAVALLRKRLPGLTLQVFGDGDYVPAFLDRVERLSLGSCVQYHGQVSLEDIAVAIPDADAGVIPNKRSVFTEINLPTRIFEYLVHRRPVIAPRTRGIMEYFGEGSLHFFNPGDAASLAEAISAAALDPAARAKTLDLGVKVFERHAWPVERDRFVGLVGGLVGGEASMPPV